MGTIGEIPVTIEPSEAFRAALDGFQKMAAELAVALQSRQETLDARMTMSQYCNCEQCRRLRGETLAPLEMPTREAPFDTSILQRMAQAEDIATARRQRVDLVDPTIDRAQGWTASAEPRDVATSSDLQQLLEWIEPTHRAMVDDLLGRAAERASAWCARTLDEAEAAKHEADETRQLELLRLYRAAGAYVHPLIGVCPCPKCRLCQNLAQKAATGCTCSECEELRRRAADLPLEPLPSSEGLSGIRLTPEILRAIIERRLSTGGFPADFNPRVN